MLHSKSIDQLPAVSTVSSSQLIVECNRMPSLEIAIKNHFKHKNVVYKMMQIDLLILFV